MMKLIVLVLFYSLQSAMCDEYVLPQHPMIVNFTKEVTKEAGRAVYLDCTVALLENPEDPTKYVEWYKLPLEDGEEKGEPLLLSKGTKMQHDDKRIQINVRTFQQDEDTNTLYTLQFEIANEEDSGLYRCKLTTPSITQSEEVKLIVTPV